MDYIFLHLEELLFYSGNLWNLDSILETCKFASSFFATSKSRFY